MLPWENENLIEYGWKTKASNKRVKKYCIADNIFVQSLISFTACKQISVKIAKICINFNKLDNGSILLVMWLYSQSVLKVWSKLKSEDNSWHYWRKSGWFLLEKLLLIFMNEPHRTKSVEFAHYCQRYNFDNKVIYSVEKEVQEETFHLLLFPAVLFGPPDNLVHATQQKLLIVFASYIFFPSEETCS